MLRTVVMLALTFGAGWAYGKYSKSQKKEGEQK